MNLLFIGDVVGDAGVEFVKNRLPSLKKYYGIDITIANGENCAHGNGILPASADLLFNSGVDVITSGNHIWQRRQIYNYLDERPYIVRPANYPSGAPGKGYCIIDRGVFSIAVINIMGTVFLDSLNNPFDTIDEILSTLTDDVKVKIVDFHAEATSEKRAFGYYLDGRVSAVIGTHTHVQTADEQIMPKGTAYITDAGMTGAIYSVLGVKVENAVSRFKTHMPVRFEQVGGDCMMCCVIIDVDEKTGLAKNIERIVVTEG